MFYLLYFGHFRSVILKNINNFDCKYGLLLNISTLQIMANLLMSYFQFHYFDEYSLVANIVVSVFLILLSLITLLVQGFSHRRPTTLLLSKVWEDKKSTNVFIWLGIFMFICLQNFVMIRYVSFWFNMYHEYQTAYEPLLVFKLKALTSFIVAIVIIEIYCFQKIIRGYNINDNIRKTIEKYNLEFKKTYFFTEGGRVIGFQSNSYLFKPGVGLFDGQRWYSPLVVDDYFNIAGIGFKDLDAGHMKNIEMYAISS